MLVGMGRLSIKQIVFNVDLMGVGGEVDKKIQEAWVTGAMLGKIICATGRGQKPKQKFAYDHTSVCGSSIRFVGAVSKMSHGMSQEL